MRDFITFLLAVALAMMSIAAVGSVAGAAPDGSISGYVHSDNGTPIGGAHVVVYSWETDIFVAEAQTSAHGTYTIAGLTLARYRIRAEAARYLPEYYRDGTHTPVTVVPPYSTDNIDFTLAPGSSISGHVYQDDEVTPISGARVSAYVEIDGGWEYVTQGYADSRGSYSITAGTGPGTYMVRAEAAGYAAEYYSGGTSDTSEGATVDVTAGGYITDVNFSLDRVGFVSGTTYMADGVTPIAGVHVVAYASGTGTEVNEGFSEANAGAYYINLSPGTYLLKAGAPGYVAEWYADATTSGAATPVSVAGLDKTPHVNFSLPTVMGVTTLGVRDVATTSACLTGNLTSLGSANEVTVSFVWRTATASYTHETPRQIRKTKGYFSFSLTELTPGTTYYYKAKAADNSDTAYGEERSFTTDDDTAPVISQLRCDTTTSIATITWTTSEAAISQIDFGLTADYSNTTGPSACPVTTHSVNLVDLRPDITYHYRIICWDASNNKMVTTDYTFDTHVYYGGMATRPWKIAGFAVVAALGVACCLMWVRMRRSPEHPNGDHPLVR